MAKALAIGIDLGTTYTCVAVYYKEQIRIIRNKEGNATTPSFVAFTEIERLVGYSAQQQLSMNPSNTIFGK